MLIILPPSLTFNKNAEPNDFPVLNQHWPNFVEDFFLPIFQESPESLGTVKNKVSLK